MYGRMFGVWIPVGFAGRWFAVSGAASKLQHACCCCLGLFPSLLLGRERADVPVRLDCRFDNGGFGPHVLRTHEFVAPFVSHCCATHFLLLVQKKVSKGKRHPGYAPARSAPVHCDARSEGMRPELGSLWRSSNSCPPRRSAPDTLRPCASRRSTRGPNTGVTTESL